MCDIIIIMNITFPETDMRVPCTIILSALHYANNLATICHKILHRLLRAGHSQRIVIAVVCTVVLAVEGRIIVRVVGLTRRVTAVFAVYFLIVAVIAVVILHRAVR